ncbi:sensor histidine kinase [Colwelliaceae bacterium BS250]
MKNLYNFYRSITLNQFLTTFFIVTILSVISAQTEIADALNRNENLSIWKPWFWAFSATYSYVLLCPIIIFCCKVWPINRQHILATTFKFILLYIPYTALFISVMLLTRETGHYIIEGVFHDFGNLWSRYQYELPKTITVYLAIIFASYMKNYYITAQKEQLKAAKLNEELAIAKIDALRNQLNPHFLFNTLNLISSTMYVSIDKADSIITRLGDLLRYSLTTESKPWVKLEEEMTVMMSFLEIAELRFGDKMILNIQISPQANSVMIPAMLLQPLLENAVKYGIEPADKSSTISLHVELLEDKLQILLSNDYHPTAPDDKSFGIGLMNTQKRLKVLYENESSLTLGEPIDGIITLKILLPLKSTPGQSFT